MGPHRADGLRLSALRCPHPRAPPCAVAKSNSMRRERCSIFLRPARLARPRLRRTFPLLPDRGFQAARGALHWRTSLGTRGAGYKGSLGTFSRYERKRARRCSVGSVGSSKRHISMSSFLDERTPSRRRPWVSSASLKSRDWRIRKVRLAVGSVPPAPVLLRKSTGGDRSGWGGGSATPAGGVGAGSAGFGGASAELSRAGKFTTGSAPALPRCSLLGPAVSVASVRAVSVVGSGWLAGRGFRGGGTARVRRSTRPRKASRPSWSGTGLLDGCCDQAELLGRFGHGAARVGLECERCAPYPSADPTVL